MTSTSNQFQLNRPAIIDETIDGEVVVVDLQQGSYYSIRGAGVDIWHALAEPITPAGVISLIAGRFGRPPAEIASTVEGFVAQLDDHGLLRRVDGEAASSVISADPQAAEPSAFEPPQLEKFTDMEDLLLLDPVHEVDVRGWPHVDLVR